MKWHISRVSAYFNVHSWLGIVLLILFGFVYSFQALRAPFWVGNDAWSNLLPIIHYRDSILNSGELPLYTDLWYGGRYQWQNPLWNFPYFPSTIVWLLAPLDWGTRIVYFGHLIFILMVARKLASLFCEAESGKVAAAIIFSSPALPAFTAGQTEKILSWGWVLLALYFLLDSKKRIFQRGFICGLCLGIIPLMGSNYHSLYAGILLLLLVLSLRDKRLFGWFLLGASIGLLHLPTIWHLVGQPRANAERSIRDINISFTGIISSLSVGLAQPMGWETWAPIGVPFVYLFFRNIFLKLKSRVRFAPIEMSLFLALAVFVLFVTSLAYQGHHLLDSFRVPARAISFIALVVTLLVLIGRTGYEKPKIGIFRAG